jgi:hypothetical protein
MRRIRKKGKILTIGLYSKVQRLSSICVGIKETQEMTAACDEQAARD